MKIVLSGVVVAAAGVALIIAAASAVWDLVTVGAAAVVVYYTVRHYRNKVSERDDVIKDREARIRLLEHDLDRAEGSKSKAEAEMARYRAQLGRQDTTVLPIMGRINGNNT